jgi:hypothetical protein
MSLEQGREASAKLSDEKSAEGEGGADWEKNQSRIREYLETLSPPKRTELEIAALMAVTAWTRTDASTAQTEHHRPLRFGYPGRPGYPGPPQDLTGAHLWKTDISRG